MTPPGDWVHWGAGAAARLLVMLLAMLLVMLLVMLPGAGGGKVWMWGRALPRRAVLPAVRGRAGV